MNPGETWISEWNCVNFEDVLYYLEIEREQNKLVKHR